MVMFTMDFGVKIRLMDSAYTHIKTVRSIQACGKKTGSMVKATKLGQMVLNLKVTISMEKSMDKANFIGQTVARTKD